VQQPKSDIGHLVVEVSSSHLDTHTHTHTHTHMLGLLRTSDYVVTEVCIYTTHNKHDRLVPMPSVGFEPTIPANKWLQTYALRDTTTGIGKTQDMAAFKLVINCCVLNTVSSTRQPLCFKTTAIPNPEFRPSGRVYKATPLNLRWTWPPDEDSPLFGN
jgi:hypothetical protein